VIVTLNNLQVNYKTASQNYCFSGDHQSIIQSPVVYELKIDSEFKRLHNEHYPGSSAFNKYWKGQQRIFNNGGLDANFHSITVTNFEGNIYANIMDTLPGPAAATAEIYKGPNYNKGPDLPRFTKNQMEKFFESQKKLSNPILMLLLQNAESYSPGFLAFVSTNHRSILHLKPWWWSFLTLSKVGENSTKKFSY
jgi:hypothetical protein